MQFIKGTRKIFMAFAIVALLLSNVLSVTSAKFHDYLYGALSHLPYESLFSDSKTKQNQALAKENSRLKKQNEKLEKKEASRKKKMSRARSLSRNIKKRIARNLTLNVSSMAGEAVPYIGIGLIVTVTAADVAAGCATAKDVNEIISIVDGNPDHDAAEEICGISVPSIDEVKNAIGGTIYEMLN